jgi:hypothetical protein
MSLTLTKMANHEAAHLTGDIANPSCEWRRELLTECASATDGTHTVRISYGLLRSYRPRAIRTTTLLIMIILSCGLIASLDVTRRTISSRDVPSSPSSNNSTDSRKRQLPATPTGTTLFSSYHSSGLPSLSAATSSASPTESPTGAAPKSDYLQLSEVPTRSGSSTAAVSGVWSLQQTDGASTMSASSQAQPSTLVSGPTGNSYVVVSQGTPSMGTSSASPTEPPTGAAPEGEYLQFQDGYYGDFTGTDYFIGVYLPILVALIYASFWGVIDANVRRMEPFYQLSRPEGAFAKDTLVFSYFDRNAFTAPIHALRRRHWAVACSSVAFLLASAVLPPIAASTLTVGVLPSCSNANQKGCTGMLIFRTHLAWLLHGGLVLNSLMAVCLILLLRKRQMGVARDPSSIVNLAATFKSHPIMEHLQATEGNASMKSVQASIGDRRYNLLTLSDGRISSVEDSGKVDFSQSDLVMNTAAPNKPRSRSRRRGLLPIAAGIVLLGLMVFLIYYHQNGVDDAFEQFMDGQSIGVRVMMVMVGVVIKAFWQRTEQSESSKHFDKHFDDFGLIRDTGAQFCEPYMKLMDGPSHPRDTILMRVRSSPLECFFAATRDRHAYLASIAFTSFCAEVLTILLPSIPFNNTEIWQAYQISHWMSMVILVIMCLALCWVTARERHSRLPRSPVTIAGGLSYLCGSQFIMDLDELEGTTRCTSRASNDIGLEERYQLNWLYDTSGVPRWLINKKARNRSINGGEHVQHAVEQVV